MSLKMRVEIETEKRFDSMTGEPIVRQRVWVKDDKEYPFQIKALVGMGGENHKEELEVSHLFAAAPVMLKALMDIDQLLYNALCIGEIKNTEQSQLSKMNSIIAQALDAAAYKPESNPGQETEFEGVAV